MYMLEEYGQRDEYTNSVRISSQIGIVCEMTSDVNDLSEIVSERNPWRSLGDESPVCEDHKKEDSGCQE